MHYSILCFQSFTFLLTFHLCQSSNSTVARRLENLDSNYCYSGNVQSAESYAAYSGHLHHHYLYLAVFYLGTMKSEFYNRAVAARLTWAKHLRYFFIVTGSGRDDLIALSNSSECKNLSNHFQTVLGGGFQQVYHCSGDVMVLHLPYCNGESWGSQGPCCRCQGAMRFYLDMHDSHHGRTGRDKFPDWFVFSDDDYYLRVTFIESYITALNIIASEPYVLMSWGGTRGAPTGINKYTTRNGFGASIFNRNCSSPCSHSIPWLGWGGLSIGAIRHMEHYIRDYNGGLVRVCARWDTTHDVGFGVFVWMMGLTAVRVVHSNNENESVIFHKPWVYDKTQSWTYDHIFDRIWQRALASSSGTADAATPFDIEKYWAYETAMGRLLAKALPPLKLTGIRTTLLYRKQQVRNELLAQIQNDTNVHPIELIDYVPADCTADKDLFESWRRTNHWPGDEDRDTASTKGGGGVSLRSAHEPRMCLEYTRYIANMHVSETDAGDLPPDEELTRKKQ
eukprot:gene8739-18060_t